MAKKRTPKQRQQDNIAKNAGKNLTLAKNKRSNDEDHDNTNSRSQAMSNIPVYRDPISSPPKGLTNLGNTCFFNSVMQNLCRTSGLLHVLTEAAKLNEITLKDENIRPLTCPLPSMFKLSQSFLNFLITMGDTTIVNNGSNRNRVRVETPRPLFSQICSVSPRFRTYQQQDSQELLQCLLDGIKSEEIKRRKQAILMKLGLLRRKAESLNDEMKEEVKRYGRIASQIPTVVDIIFGGEIVSSVLCDECGRFTQVHEEFLDIPLPIAETHSSHHSHNTLSKKAKNKPQKQEPVRSSSSESEKEIQETSFKADSSSKHAKKKEKEQKRKNKHKRKRTKSQNALQLNDGKDRPPPQKEELGIENIITLENGSVQNEQQTDPSQDHREKSAGEKVKENPVEKKTNGAEHSTGTNHSHEPTNSDMSDVADLQKGMGSLSLSSSAIPVTDRDIGQQKAVDTFAEEIVCEIILTALNNVDDTSNQPVVLELPIAVEKVESVKNTETHLLGGRPIPLNDEETDDLTSKDLSENDSPSRKSGTSPSSGNDEKSDSENPAPTRSLFETPIKRPEVKLTGFCKKLPSSLSARYEPDKTECSILTCLHKFTMAEMLTGSNKFGCEECTKRQNKGVEKPKTVYCNASKQMLIETPPLILTLQLKRFQQAGSSLRKLSKRVVIPQSLDISPFCSYEARKYANNDNEIRYNVYGIVEHSGSMSRGHYTAYVNVRPENKYFSTRLGNTRSAPAEELLEEDQSQGQWYHFSDTSVSKCTLEKALNCNAYLIFYEREQ